MGSGGIGAGRSGGGEQPGVRLAAWWCRLCGSTALLARGLCHACCDRRRRSEQFFGGCRETVLTRDSCCQLCLSKERLLAHHRQPGRNRLASQITLCWRCHAPVHHRHQLPGFYSDLFLRLWREQHPNRPAQLRLPWAG
jgi:hypothetical protein